MKANGQLVAGLLAHMLLIGLPGVAAALLALRRGLKDTPLILGVALLASGATAFLAFWAYYADPLVGRGWDYLLALGSAGLIAWLWRERRLDRAVLRRLRTPLLLWVLVSCFVVFLGFLHGGTENPVAMSALRFSGQLPTDNDIPRYFAEWFSTHGHQNPPPTYPPDWLMSDRPPLQVGYVLAQRGFFNTPAGLHYEILCTIVQALWVVGMWAVLVAARLRPRTRALAMFAAIVSDIAILHGFFVWPKLIAAAFLLAALAIVISPAWERRRLDLRVAALVGALLGLALLAHGSSVFGIVPLAAIALYRGLPSWRWIGVAAVAGVVVMVPWSAYQHYANPPGNRLLKYQLGGDLEVDSKGTLEAIVDGYEEAGWEGTLDLKADNFGEMVGWPRLGDEYEEAIDGLDEGKPGIALTKVRGPRFFCLLPLLGLLLVGPLAMLFARLRGRERDEGEWRFALICFGFGLIASVIWGLLLYGTPSTRATIHVGTLAVPLLAIVGCVVGMAACFPRLAAWVVGLNALLVMALYTPSLEPLPGTAYSPLTALLAAASLAAIGWVLFGRAADAEPEPELAATP